MNRAVDVLYIEDNEDYVEFVKRAITKVNTNLTYHALFDGSDALSYFETDTTAPKAKLILLDVNLPGMSGIELLKKIRSKPALKYTPVIMFSTSDNETDVTEAYDSGANAYLVKPEGLNSLVKTLQGVCDFWLKLNYTSN
jgi:DNA-binding response OmpR family regulator